MVGQRFIKYELASRQVNMMHKQIVLSALYSIKYALGFEKAANSILVQMKSKSAVKLKHTKLLFTTTPPHKQESLVD